MDSNQNKQNQDTGFGEGGKKLPATIKQLEEEAAMQNYRNSGYGQNADNNNPNNNPVKDPTFNKNIRTSLTEGLTDEDLLLKTIKIHNQMGSILGEYPYIGIDKTNIYDDKYNLSQDNIKDFNTCRRFVEEVNNVAPKIITKYGELLNKLKTHRQKMADVLEIEPYPGIENEDIDKHINDKSKQLDDWKIAILIANKESINEMKKQYPSLFDNVINKNKDNDQTKDIVQVQEPSKPLNAPAPTMQNLNPQQGQTQNPPQGQNPNPTQNNNNIQIRTFGQPAPAPTMQNLNPIQGQTQNAQQGQNPNAQQGQTQNAQQGQNPNAQQGQTPNPTQNNNNNIQIRTFGQPVPAPPVPNNANNLPINIVTFNPPAPAPQRPDFITRVKDYAKANQLLPKALYGAAGFVTGVGLSCVPGVGQVRMVIAGVKLGTAAVNLGIKIVTRKYPDCKLSKFLYKVDNGFKQKFPKINDGIEKFKKKKATPPIKWALNGLALGYIAGNVYELVTGDTVVQAIFAKPKHIAPVVPDGTTFNNLEPGQAPANTTFVPNDSGPVGSIGYSDTVTPEIHSGVSNEVASSTFNTAFVHTSNVPDVTAVPDIPATTDTTALEAAIKAGQNVDISSIPFGRVSSDAENAVKLLQSAGKNVHFLREVTLSDGTVMWAMDQANGLGYAWFPKEEVLETVSQLGTTVVR